MRDAFTVYGKDEECIGIVFNCKNALAGELFITKRITDYMNRETGSGRP